MEAYHWQNLYNILKRLVSQTEQILRQYNKSVLPIRERYEYYQEKWYIQTRKTEKVDFELAIWNLEEKIFETDSYKALIAQLSDSQDIYNLLNGIIYANNGSRTITTKEVIFRFLGEFFNRTELIINDTEFDKLYGEFEDALLRTEVMYNIIVHVQGFISDIDKYQFGSIILKKMTLEELNEIFGEESYYQDSEYTRYNFCFLSECIYYRKIQINEPKDRATSFPEKDILNNIDEFVSKLRLFKPGYIAIDRYFILPKNWEIFPFGHGSTHSTETIIQKDYFLSSSEIDELDCFLSSYSQNKFIQNKSYVNALHWLSNSSLKQYAIDRFLDYIIVLESLFLEGRHELSFRLPLRVSYYLGKNHEERLFYFYLLREAYTLRSDLVHDGKPLPPEIIVNSKKYRSDKFIETISEIVYQSINRIIKDTKYPFPGKETKVWDSLILSGLPYDEYKKRHIKT